MAAQYSTQAFIAGNFKKVYDRVTDMVTSKGTIFQDEIAPFEQRKKAGKSVTQAVVLSHENGLTLGGSDGDVYTFKDPQSQACKEAEIYPCEIFVSSGLTTGAASRAAQEGEQAFKSATSLIVKGNLKSHKRFVEFLALYGRDAYGIGRVAYFTGTWRGVAFTDGGGTLGGVTFTAGVNTSSKHILINPNEWATGLYIGAEGLEVAQIKAADGSEEAAGKIVSVDLENGFVKVDFTPVAATTGTSHFLALKAQAANGSGGTLDMIGAKTILSTSASSFGIDPAVYALWKGSNFALGGKKLTFPRLVEAVQKACDKGLDRDVEVLVSFDSWRTLLTEQTALRSYDDSYTPTEVVNGAVGITFHFLNGKITVRPSRFVRRSDAFVFTKDDWKRFGSTDMTLKIPGMDEDLVVKPITSNLFIFRSYSDQQVFCFMPSQSVYISGIDPDSAT